MRATPSEAGVEGWRREDGCVGSNQRGPLKRDNAILRAPPVLPVSQPLPSDDRRLRQLHALGPERARFRELIGKVGSGEHTSTGLTREEARTAMDLMLQGTVSDAQMGAFLIAHRIRRPLPLELTGMLDSYRSHGPALETPGQRALCFGVPYDGRSRTAPLLPLLALMLASAGVPVVLHGGNPMPVKYGVTLAELFAALGIEWRGLSLNALQQRLSTHQLALSHQPDHFPDADRLLTARDEIGKRPPVASLELLWTPHRGDHLLVSGFVHPPTEKRAWEALAAAGETEVLTVKGLEGSTDLPTSRAGITARRRGGGEPERILLHPRDHGLQGEEVPWLDLDNWRQQARPALRGEGPLAAALLWNLAAYLWLAERFDSLNEALTQARALLAARSGERLLAALGTPGAGQSPDP
ncbi:MAG: anthranilate phosphoribosyltransferase [Cyanobacteria bacterium K_DeepCast_35m_m2_155]|nr:anthranilate phosphoribosyltransferase [Cyanobacteria bacterium K_DeepCast_35m_m2_155]